MLRIVDLVRKYDDEIGRVKKRIDELEQRTPLIVWGGKDSIR
jgi:hypothetical protein